MLNCTSFAVAQLPVSINKEQYQAEVKLVDEFFSRFNGESCRSDLDSSMQDRKTNIMLLFDLGKIKSKTDTQFLAIDSFAQHVVRDSLFIHYTDTAWQADVKCRGKLKGKDVEFDLVLKTERRGDEMYKWVISDAKGEIFETLSCIDNDKLFIMPNQHEQFFSALQRITKEDYNLIDDYVRSGFKCEPLSVFLTLVRSGQLKIDYVSSVELIFHQIPGYVFSVRHFNRESKNAGWLIDSLSKVGNSNDIN